MNKKDREHLKLINDMSHDLIVAMQAAYIEWRHGKGAEAAMQWIGNTLSGPGLLPDPSEPWSRDAQAWHSANQSNPLPVCSCGKPSHIGWMGQGFCCEEHYRTARTKSLKTEGATNA